MTKLNKIMFWVSMIIGSIIIDILMFILAYKIVSETL